MNGKHKSTNSKLYEIIHSKNNDEQDEENLLEKEEQAKIRLRRTSLYGGGARTKIPKIKKSKEMVGQSPFTVGKRDVVVESLQSRVKEFDNTIPPGAHSDQFRLVTNNTELASRDPDRIFYNSSSMQEGLHVIPQPPWYYGNNNKIKPADGHLIMSAGRYGYRGSQQISQYSTEVYEEPSKTRTKFTPKFLDNGDYVNEWVPPIIMATHQTINGLESPKLWPENTAYVTGYKKKDVPTSWSYRRQTTVDLLDRPFETETLGRTMGSFKAKADLLQRCATLESKNQLKSLPIDQQEKFTKTWNENVFKHANSSLRSHMNTERAGHEAHSLMDPTDVIHYSGTTAMIVHSQTTEELKFRLRMERTQAKSKTPFTLRWSLIVTNFKEIQNKLKRKESMELAIGKIGDFLREQALSSGSETTINRVDFISTCRKISFFEDTSPKALSILYSIFDPMKRNAMRFVEFVACMKVLDYPEQTAFEKIIMLWHVNHTYGLDRNVFDIALDILCTCCYTMEEVREMEQLFKEEFRPKCYRHALSVPSSGREDAASTRSGSRKSDSRKSDSRKSDSRKGGSRGGDGSTQESAPEYSEPPRGLSVQPQYNVCEHFLNAHTFVAVLNDCPKIVAAFDEHLSEKLVMILGSDPRKVVKDDAADEKVNAVVADFKWIFAKQGNKMSKFESGFKPPPAKA